MEGGRGGRGEGEIGIREEGIRDTVIICLARSRLL